MKRNQATWELAKALHADRGMEDWWKVSEATRKRWFKRAEQLIARCPTLNTALTLLA